MKSLAGAGFRDKVIVRSICAYAIIMLLWVFGGLRVTHGAEFPVVVESNLIRVEAPAGYDKYAKSVMAHAQAALRELNSKTGDALMVPVTFQVAPDRELFLQLAGGEGEHALAVARGDKRLVIISLEAMNSTDADKIQQVLVHELAHIYLDVKTEAPVPRWVHEGVAQVIAGEWPDAPGEGMMAISAYTGGLIPLQQLVDGFPADAANRNQAYAQSYSAMRHLIRKDHSNSLVHFLKSIRGAEGAPYLKKLGGTVHLNALDWSWRQDLKSPVSALNVLLGSGFLWGVAAVLMVIAYFVKKRRSKVLHERWAADEATYADAEEVPMELEFGEYEEGEEPEGSEPWR